MISNPNNPTIRQIRKLRKRRERDKRRQVIVEGHRSLSVAIHAKADVSKVLHTPSATTKRSELLQDAREQALHSLRYAYADRRTRKGDFRRLWIARINAACREHGMSYNRFINGLKLAQVDIDRRMLSDLAVRDKDAFGALVEVARAGLQSSGGPRSA